MVALFAKRRTIAGEKPCPFQNVLQTRKRNGPDFYGVDGWAAGCACAGRDPQPESELVVTTTESTTFPVDHGKKWLGDLDSNQDSQIQNLESYRWTISHPLRRNTSRDTFSETMQPQLYSSNLVGISETVNRWQLQIAPVRFYRCVVAAEFPSADLSARTGAIWPSRTTYSSLPHVMRLEPKLTSQITK